MSKNSEIEIKISGKVDPSFNTSVNAASKKLNNINGSTKNVSKSFGNAGKAGQKFGNQTSSAVQSLDQVLAAAGIVAALNATYDAFYDCIEVAEEYETALAKVATIADTSSSESISSIKSEITALSTETGQSVTDLSEATYQAISASVDTADSVEFVKQANMLAVGGFTETTSAVNVLTTALNAYGLSADQTSSISDMLIQTQNKGKTTVDELANSLGTVIPTAAAYNVNMQNVAASYAQLTKNGIATQNAGTYLRGMLNELAKDGSTVSTVLKQETGMSFSELMNSGKSLGEVLEILGDSVDGDTTKFSNLWSNTRAATGALSIYNAGAEAFNETLSDMNNSAGLTADAYSTMTDTSEHAAQVFNNAGDQLKISIGEALEPSAKKLYEVGAEGLEMLTSFVEANPGVVQALAAGTVALTVFTGGLALYTVGAKAAAVATGIFTAVLDTNPIFLAVTATTALVAAIGAFSFASSESTEETEEMTVATKNQEKEIEKLNAEYDEATKKYGKNSYQAVELKSKIDDLTDSYNSSKQTLSEFVSNLQSTHDSYTSAMSTHSDNILKLESEETATSNLVTRLQELGSQSKISAEDQAEMQNIIDILNAKMPSLGLTYKTVSSNIKGSVKEINQAIQENITTSKYEEYTNALQTAQENQQGLKTAMESANAEFENAENKMDGYQSLLNNSVSNWENMSWLDPNKYLLWGGDNASGIQSTIDGYQDTYDTLKEKNDQATKDYEDNEAAIKKYTKEIQKLNAQDLGINLDTNDETQKQINSAALEIKTDLESLGKAYENAYETASDSFNSQYKLWDKVATVSTTSVSTTTSNIQSQIDYWKSYNDNLSSLEGMTGQVKGLSDVLKQLDDGSEKSASILAGMAESAKSGNTSALQTLVDKYSELDDNRKSAAKTTAEVETDYEKSFKSIKKTAEDSLDLSTEAGESAKKVIDAYVDEIASETSKNKISAAFTTAMTGASSILTYNGSDDGVAKHAKGTDYAENIFIAGEEGPELIVGQKGAKVFTASETQKILSGNADGNTQESSDYNYSFDIPELYSQLLENLSNTAKSQSLEKAVQDYSDITNNDNSSISFAPQITVTVTGGKSSDVEQGVQKAVNMSLQQFEKLMKQYTRSTERKNFKG